MAILSQVFGYRTRNSPVELKTVEVNNTLGPNDVLIDTRYTSLNPLDLKLKSLAWFPWDWRCVHDFSGVVTAAGSAAASKFTVGEKVCGFWIFGATVGSVSKVNIKRNALMSQPKSLSDAQAAALPTTFATALLLVNATTIDSNSSALVLGGGTSVGAFVIQLLKKQHHVRRVVTTCSPDSVKYAHGFGADETLDYKAPDFKQQLLQSAQQEKFQNVYDCAGGNSALEVADQIMDPSSSGSTYVTCAGDANLGGSNYSKVMLGFVSAMPRMLIRTITGKYSGINWKVVVANGQALEGASDIIDRYKIKVPVDSQYDAKDVQKACEKLDTTKVKGKIVLKF